MLTFLVHATMVFGATIMQYLPLRQRTSELASQAVGDSGDGGDGHIIVGLNKNKFVKPL
jgi:hypothetical protein